MVGALLWDVEYTLIDVQFDQEKRAEMTSRSNRHTVPQIFINEQHIGGSDELAEIVQSGKFDELIAAKSDT